MASMVSSTSKPNHIYQNWPVTLCLGATNNFLKLLWALPVKDAYLRRAMQPESGESSQTGKLLREPSERTSDGAGAVRGEADIQRETAELAADRRDFADLQHDFNALVGRHQQRIYNLAYQHIGDSDEASDITQETFISAYRARQNFRGEARVFTWLFRIAINHTKNRLKAKSRSRTHEGPSLDSTFDQEGGEPGGDLLESSLVADWSQAPETVLEQGELLTKIREAIEALPFEYRSVLILREMEDMNYNDIAAATGLSLEAVKTRISRARAMVRRRVSPYYSAD